MQCYCRRPPSYIKGFKSYIKTTNTIQRHSQDIFRTVEMKYLKGTEHTLLNYKVKIGSFKESSHASHTKKHPPLLEGTPTCVTTLKGIINAEQPHLINTLHMCCSERLVELFHAIQLSFTYTLTSHILPSAYEDITEILPKWRCLRTSTEQPQLSIMQPHRLM